MVQMLCWTFDVRLFMKILDHSSFEALQSSLYIFNLKIELKYDFKDETSVNIISTHLH